MLFWTIAYRNVRKNWRHSLSALLSISASFVSLVLFDGYIDDLKQMYRDSFERRSMLGQLIIEKPEIHSKAGLAEPWKYLITEKDQQLIEEFISVHADAVKNRVRFVNFQGMVSNGQQSSIFLGRGFDLTEGERVRGKNWSWNATFGKPLHMAQLPTAALLGHGLAKKMGCSWDKPKDFYTFSGGYEPVERPFNCSTTELQISGMTAEGQVNALDISVVGLMDAGYRDIDDRYLVTSIETAQTMTNSKSVNMISIELKDSRRQKQFMELFKQSLGSKIEGIDIMTWIEHPVGETYLKTLDLMAIFRNFVVFVILIISVLSVINTLIKIIKERNREIGTLRSLGFKSGQVLKMFVYETLLLSMIGTVIGLAVSIVLTVFLNGLQIRYKAGMLSEPVLFKISFDLVGYFHAFAILMLVSVFACLLATRREVNKKIIDNFTHV